MSHLKYNSYPGLGVQNLQNFHYNQAVRIPAGADRVEIAGQGGWNPTTRAIHSDLLDEIDQAFANVQLALQDAGLKAGWNGVFRVNSYHVGFDGDQERVLGRMVENLKKWCPGHAPLWTCVGVTALGMEGMRVEIEVVAVDEK